MHLKDKGLTHKRLSFKCGISWKQWKSHANQLYHRPKRKTLDPSPFQPRSPAWKRVLNWNRGEIITNEKAAITAVRKCYFDDECFSLWNELLEPGVMTWLTLTLTLMKISAKIMLETDALFFLVLYVIRASWKTIFTVDQATYVVFVYICFLFGKINLFYKNRNNSHFFSMIESNVTTLELWIACNLSADS